MRSSTIQSLSIRSVIVGELSERASAFRTSRSVSLRILAPLQLPPVLCGDSEAARNQSRQIRTGIRCRTKSSKLKFAAAKSAACLSLSRLRLEGRIPRLAPGHVMTVRSSLFAKIRADALALGRSEQTATRKARLLSVASFSDFVRLTPEQNVKLGLSRKARHYVLKGRRITKATPTISARQFETKRASELFGLTPERATQARRYGAVSYVSADQRERVAKAAITREETKIIAEIKKLRASAPTRSELFARQKAARNFAFSVRVRRAPLSRPEASQARRRTYTGRRLAVAGRLCASVQRPEI
jgi:hypothetical protein